ncbi:MAG: pip [Propionibacteriaceae bacterium]|nr:pip [Propionibacteriaceae bacterium]
MPARFPAGEPYAAGLLDVGDGHRIYWEESGNPEGLPAVFLHGGPGGGSTPGARRNFDPDVYRVLLYDQRGCGRSRPLAEEPDVDLSTNTTAHLVGDLELLRQARGIEQWTMLGVSWGTTLGLAYAEAYPQRVRRLVLAAVTTTSRREVQWITEDVGRVFPREWERFRAGVPGHLAALPLVTAYARLLTDPDPRVCATAAKRWCEWEDAHVSLTPGHSPSLRYQEPDFRLRFARLVTHYWSNAAFLAEDQLVGGAAILDGIPGALIHGRFDVSSPLETAWQLSKVWTTSTFQVVDDAGHGGGGFAEAMISALSVRL